MSNEKNPGVAADDVTLPYVPHDRNAVHVERANVVVDAAAPSVPLEPIWASLGFDEINWACMPRGKRLLKRIGDFSSRSFLVRPHNVFTSGTGFGLPHWGSGNVYHEDENGIPYLDFSIVDEVYDAIVGSGHHLIVELGFTPRDLVPDEAKKTELIDSPSLYSAYEAFQWSFPPKDFAKWGLLVSGLVEYCLERYGKEEVSHWLWELWNEPDIFYWRDSKERFYELYGVTAAAVKNVFPGAKVGGPTVTGGPDGVEYMREFLRYCADGQVPLDFGSFHTKGSNFSPWRTYKPLKHAAETTIQQSPSVAKMLFEIERLLDVMAEFPQYSQLPVYITECDAGVPAHWGVYDNPNFQFQNTAYYASFQASLIKKLLDLNDARGVNIRAATTWSFYFEGERMFEGTRSFITANDIEKPLMNIYRVFAQLGDRRLHATSSASWALKDVRSNPRWTAREEVDVLATDSSSDGSIAVLLYRHTDDQWTADEHNTSVELRITGLPAVKHNSVVQYVISHNYSNAHSIWTQQRSPSEPDAAQLDQLRARQGLERGPPVESGAVQDGVLNIGLSMPLHTASLVVVDFEG